ncbi:hypothetical protein HYDPIDRAFT_108376 [Hydnomerulius pinastri MD-312]|nr:hypothetical protein HYDPIDRAFT_108376 [Hydnomerulius pinastri MD-312]
MSTGPLRELRTTCMTWIPLLACSVSDRSLAAGEYLSPSLCKVECIQLRMPTCSWPGDVSEGSNLTSLPIV